MTAYEVTQWHNRESSPDDFILVRLYSDGSTTASRCVLGSYSPELDLVAYPVEAVAS